MKTILLFIALLSPLCAEEFYVAQTAAGAGNGTSEANAYGISFFNTAGNWGAGAGKISGGDTVWICGTMISTLTIQGSGSAGNMITIKYAPGAKSSKASWTVVYNGNMSTGAWNASNKSYFKVDGVAGNGIVECTDNGDGGSGKSAFNHAGGFYFSGCNNFEITGVTIRDIYIHTYNRNNEAGIGGYSTWGIFLDNCHTYEVHHNIISQAYTGIYSRTSAGGSYSGHKFYSNIISSCSTGSIVSLGATSSMSVVEAWDNNITMGYNWTAANGDNHVDGIHWWTSGYGALNNVRIFGNYIHGDPGPTCTGYVFVEGLIPDAQIFNNRLIAAPGGNRPMEGLIDVSIGGGATGPLIMHNTLVGTANSNSGGNGIAIYGATAMSIKNNLFKQLNIAIFNDPSTVTTRDYDFNNFDALVAPGRRGATYSYSLAAWKTSSGAEADSTTTAVTLDANYKLTSDILPGTNSVNSIVSTDFEGDARFRYNMGADEYTSAPTYAPVRATRRTQRGVLP